MRYEPQLYTSPIALSEGRSGKMRLSHRIVKDKVAIVGMRQAYLRGIAPVTAKIDDALTIHELSEDGVGVWMTDLPEELNQIGELLHNINPQGKILVGGLGLGILAKVLSANHEVHVVERSADVINLCAQSGYLVHHDDLYQHLRYTKERYDFYLLDTWQGTNEATWWEEVMPAKRIIRNRWGAKPVVHCWAEDIMVGQIVRTMTSRCGDHWHYDGLPMPMTAKEALSFTSNVGKKTWEERYGRIVDRSAKKVRDE